MSPVTEKMLEKMREQKKQRKPNQASVESRLKKMEDIILHWDSQSPRTPAFSVILMGEEFMFSYRTLIAYRGKFGTVRLENRWSNTTGKHFNIHGAKNFPVVNEKEMEVFVLSSLVWIGKAVRRYVSESQICLLED